MKYLTMPHPHVPHPHVPSTVTAAWTATKEEARTMLKPDGGTAGEAGSQGGQTSSNVTTSPPVRSDFEGGRVDIDSKHDGEVLVDDLRSGGQLREAEVEGGIDEERSRAATTVQARFRGHKVRTSQPLVQLRAIAGIEVELEKFEEEAGDAAFLEEIGKENSKAKLEFEEGTLALLLRLDDIQSSDPVVRQIRKSVVREIIALQENVDALLTQRSSSSDK